MLMNLYADSVSIDRELVVQGLERLVELPQGHPDSFRVDSHEIERPLDYVRGGDTDEERVAAAAEKEPTRTRAERRAALRDAVRAAQASGDTTELETEAARGRHGRVARPAAVAPTAPRQARTSRKGSR